MTLKRRIMSGLCLLTGFALASYVRCFWAPAHFSTTRSLARLGRELPPLPVADASGRTVDIGRIALGRKSIIVFYSSSCRVCRVVLPRLLPFPCALNLLLVNEEREGASSCAGAMGFQAAICFYDRDRVHARSFPMSGLPTVLFVDERGVLRDGLVGEHSRDLLQKKLKEFARAEP